MSEASLGNAATAWAALTSFAMIGQLTILIGLIQSDRLRGLIAPLQDRNGAFSLSASFEFAAGLACVMLASGARSAWQDARGIMLGALIGGLSNAHEN